MQSFAQNLHNAITSLNQGNRKKAIALGRDCIALEPQNADAHLVLGTCLQHDGQKREALEHFKTAVRLKPDHFRANVNLGLCQMGLNDSASAVLAFRRALELEPLTSEVEHYLGCALANCGQYSAAVEHFAVAVEANPKNARMFRDYGSALERLSNHDGARRAYETALQINPEYALVHLRLGHIQQVEGNFTTSEEHLRTCLRLTDRFPQAYQMLSVIERIGSKDIEQINELLGRGQLNDQDREALHAALGRYYDRLGEYSKAFANFKEANDLRSASVTYDPDVHDSYVDDVIWQFDAKWFDAPTVDAFGPKLIFLVGMPRSGSTLFHQILSSHPDVRGVGESGIIERLIHSQPADLNIQDGKSALWSQERLVSLKQDYLQALPDDVVKTPFIVDKSLDNVYLLGPILRAFANAQVLLCARNPLDSILSCYFSSFRDSLSYTFDLDHLVRRKLAMDKLTKHWMSVLPGKIHQISYEQVVEDAESGARSLLDAAGLPWNPACLEFQSLGENSVTSSIYQVRQPIYSSSVNRWTNYQRQLESQISLLETG